MSHEDDPENPLQSLTTMGTTHQENACAREEQAGLRRAGVRQPPPLIPLGLSLGKRLGRIPTASEVTCTTVSQHNSVSSSYEEGSGKYAAIIGYPHKKSSCTRELQAELRHATVKQPPPLIPMGLSLGRRFGPVTTASEDMSTTVSLHNTVNSSYEEGSEKSAAIIGSPHQKSSCTGEEQAGLWPAGVRQPVPPSQLAPSLPPQLGRLPVPRKAMYMVSSVCNSTTEHAATIGSTHDHGSSTGEEQAGLWPAGVREPVPPSQLSPSLLPQLGRLPVPRKAMYTVSSVCNSSTEGAATIGSTHEHVSSTEEEQAELWPAGVRQPVHPSQLPPSLPPQLGRLPVPRKAMYIVSSLCNSSTESAATIGSTHDHGSSTGEEQAGLWPSGVRQPVPPSQLAPSLPPQLGPLYIPRKALYTVSSVCKSTTDGAATINSTHNHGSNTGEEQAGLWPASVRQPVPSSQLAPSLAPQLGPLPIQRKAMYTVSPVCNSRRTSHDGGSTEGAATIGAAHEHRSCTGEEQAGLWPADVRQSVPSFQLAPSLPPQRGPLPIVRRAIYTVSPVCNSSRTLHHGGSTEGAATIDSTHEHGSCTGDEQAELRSAGVRQPVPPSQLARSVPPQLRRLPIPRKAMYMVSSVCNSSTEGATAIGSTHEHGSSTGEEQAGMWPAGVRQPVPSSQLAPSLAPQLGPLPIQREAMYTVSPVCNSSRTSHEGGSTEGAATIGSAHEHGSCTGEEQAGLWPAGVRQSVPSFQLVPSLPPQRGPLPIVRRAIYTVSPVCNSSRTSHHGGSTEGAATIDSTHEHGSCTGDEEAELRPAGVRQPVPPSQLARSLPPQLGRLPIPRKAMYMVSSVCNSSTEGATAIGSTHEHRSSTGEEQAGPWVAGFRQPVPPFQLAPSWPPQLGPLPIPQKAMYKLSSVCKSSSTSHDGGSTEGAATISSTHEHGSSTGDEQAELRPAGVSQPVHPSQLACSLPPQLGRLPIPRKAMYVVSSVCNSSTEGATAIGSTHEHGSSTGFPQHRTMGGIMLTTREAPCPMPASRIHMIPSSKPSFENKQKRKRGEFPEHEAMRGITLTSREAACPMTASSINMKPISKPSTEYMTKLKRGDILVLRPYNERKAAAVQDVPAVEGQYRKGTMKEVSGLYQIQSPVQFPRHEAMRGIMLTSREGTCPMTATSIKTKPTSKPSTEYMTKLNRGDILALRPYNERQAAAVQDVPVVGGHYRKAMTREVSASFQTQSPAQFPQHEAMGGIILTNRQAACPMTTSSINMKPRSRPSVEYMTKQERGEFPQHETIRRFMLTSREAACPMTTSSLNMKPPSKPSMEYKTKQKRGKFSEQRIMGVSASAMAETVSASTFNDTMPGRASTEYTEKQTEGEFSEQRIMGVSASAMAETVSASTFNDTMPGRAPTEYTEKQTDGEFSEQRIMGVSASAMAETVSASTFNDTMPGRAPTEYTEKQTDGEFSEQRIMGVSASAMAETVSASTFNDTMPGRAPTEYTEKQTDGEDKHAETSSAQQPSPLPPLSILRRSEEELLQWPLPTPQDVEYYIGLPLYASSSSSLGVATAIHTDADTSEESPTGRG